MAAPQRNCDVLVIGGGAAGIAAATAAGRAGAKTILLERYGFLGGLATAAQVGTICGVYLRDTAGAKAVPVSGGFAQEFASRLQETGGTKPLCVDRGLWMLPYSPPDFARVADALVGEAKNVQLILHATVAETRADNSKIISVRALAWNEPPPPHWPVPNRKMAQPTRLPRWFSFWKMWIRLWFSAACWKCAANCAAPLNPERCRRFANGSRLFPAPAQMAGSHSN